MARLRANIYIDGFNLYYRALKENRCNWLNLSKLGQYATTTRRIRAGALRASLFPDELTDSVGTFRKPASW